MKMSMSVPLQLRFLPFSSPSSTSSLFLLLSRLFVLFYFISFFFITNVNSVKLSSSSSSSSSPSNSLSSPLLHSHNSGNVFSQDMTKPSESSLSSHFFSFFSNLFSSSSSSNNSSNGSSSSNHNGVSDRRSAEDRRYFNSLFLRREGRDYRLVKNPLFIWHPELYYSSFILPHFDYFSKNRTMEMDDEKKNNKNNNKIDDIYDFSFFTESLIVPEVSELISPNNDISLSAQTDGNNNVDNDDSELTLLMALPQGVCEGVVRAIDTVETALKVFGAPVYVKHEIVHNRLVCDDLRSKGAVFIEDLREVPSGSRVIFSAHGVSPAVMKEAEDLNLEVIDATCPLVSKVHQYVKKAAASDAQIVLVGHRNHVEIQGVKGEAPDRVTVVESVKEVLDLDESKFKNKPLFYATQTTLGLRDVEEIIAALLEKFPQAETIPSGSICFATTNRQSALETALQSADACIVIGDLLSSNAVKLVELGLRKGVPSFLVNAPKDIVKIPKYVKKLCISASASSPPYQVNQIIKHIQNIANNNNNNQNNNSEEKKSNVKVEYLKFADEDFKWKLPKNLMQHLNKKNQQIDQFNQKNNNDKFVPIPNIKIVSVKKRNQI